MPGDAKLQYIIKMTLLTSHTYRKSIRKLRDPSVDIHEKRKVLENPDLGEGLLESVESVVTPILKKKRIN